MSDTNKSETNVLENNAATGKSKKKERRQQKAKQEAVALNAQSNHSNEKVEKDSTENVESDAPSTSAITEPMDEAQIKSLLDEAIQMKSKFNPNMFPMLRDIAKTPQEALQKPFKFWSTQPVPKFDEVIEHNEPIEPNKTISEIRADPYALPDGFKWDTMTLDDPLVLTELYTLLNENYVEDDDAMFRFDYQPEFLKWALQPPGWRKGNSLHYTVHFGLFP